MTELNPHFLQRQILVAPSLEDNRPGSIEVVLVCYMDAPEEVTLANGEKLMLDCIVAGYPGSKYTPVCSGLLRPAL